MTEGSETVQWPWKRWRLIRRGQVPPELVMLPPDPDTRRSDTDRVSQLLSRVEILERRRDIQLRGVPYRGRG